MNRRGYVRFGNQRRLFFETVETQMIRSQSCEYVREESSGLKENEYPNVESSQYVLRTGRGKCGCRTTDKGKDMRKLGEQKLVHIEYEKLRFYFRYN